LVLGEHVIENNDAPWRRVSLNIHEVPQCELGMMHAINECKFCETLPVAAARCSLQPALYEARAVHERLPSHATMLIVRIERTWLRKKVIASHLHNMGRGAQMRLDRWHWVNADGRTTSQSQTIAAKDANFQVGARCNSAV
jgi:hypothetical protein